MVQFMMYDTVVVGLGAIGSVAVYELARRGQRVLGLEQYALVHDRGSYSGESRLFRMAYHEGEEYVPFLQESRDKWLELNRLTGRDLLHQTGALTISSPGTVAAENLMESVRRHDIPHRVLDTDELRATYPQHLNVTDEVAVLDKWGGFLRPDAAVYSIQGLAQAHGAELRSRTEVLGIDEVAGGVQVTTDAGVFLAARVIVAAGGWSARLLPEAVAASSIRPIGLGWYIVADPARYMPDVFPGFIRESAGVHIYGFPTLNNLSIKLGHVGERPVLPSVDDLPVRDTAEHLRVTADTVSGFLDGLLDGPAHHSMHMELFTPDRRPLLGMVGERVVLATGFSGHGFKLAPAFGAVAAALAAGDEPAHDVGAFAPDRFA